jgi:hypothetical protein
MSEDERNLDFLAVFHYVVGGLTALFACFPLIHVAIGLAMVLGAFKGKEPPPPFLGWFFIILGGCFVLCGWALALAIIIAGRRLKKRVSRNYCLVVGVVECMIMPFGTILGVFTLIMLMRDSVRQLFATEGRGATTPGPSHSVQASEDVSMPTPGVCPHCGYPTMVLDQRIAQPGPCAACAQTITGTPGHSQFSPIEENAAIRMLIPIGRSGWAIAAGYAGLVSALIFPAPLAILFGILAIRDIKKHPQKHGLGRAIFGLVAGIAFPVLIILLIVWAAGQGARR